MSKNIRCIVKCVINFEDGMIDPPVVARGEILDISEDQFHKLSKSGPNHFELIERKFLVPEGTVIAEIPAEEVIVRPATPEEEAEELQFTSTDEIEDWKPIPWYAAQLAREPASDEA